MLLGVGHGSGRHEEIQNLGHVITIGGRKFLHLGDASTEDRSIFDLLSADFTFANEKLAQLYGIKDVSGNEFRRVSLRLRATLQP